MGYTFRKLKKLWLLYLFLLFFSFFMFAISINVYLQSMNTSDLREMNKESYKKSPRKQKMNIIVAQYVGSGNIFGNMSKEEMNKNEFAPIESEGALGKPVVIPPHETLVMQRKFEVNKFNLLASDRIPLNRTLKDYRMKECVAKQYPSDLPTTSIIIVFHNEAWSVLLRTVWSVINRSPRELLKEILLVDDASDRGFLMDDLDNYTKTLPVSTKVLRLNTRQGLVPARLLGAKHAEGDVLTFLDAHCECSPGWLEPLLFRIKENPRSVICPVIDIISDENFSYTKTFENHWGAFNWQLHFRWFVLTGDQIEKRKDDVTEPIQTPAMAGGLFSINKKYFYEMGAYDEEMKIWGGENVEMSFRIWQCGGSVEISPCSHVGHLFRKSSPYTFPGGVNEILQTNLARAALVWMDKWADFFFIYNPINMEVKNKLNVTDRLALRKRLNCKSFDWYLRNIWPNHFFPSDDRLFAKIALLNKTTALSTAYNKYLYSIPGRLTDDSWISLFKVLRRHSDVLLGAIDLNQDSCLRASADNSIYGNSVLSGAIVGGCNPDQKLQDMFVIAPNGQIMTNENICLDSYEGHSGKKDSSNVRLFNCHGNSRQLWAYDINNQQIRHIALELCLTAEQNLNNKEMTLKATTCKEGNTLQKWALVPLPWKF